MLNGSMRSENRKFCGVSIGNPSKMGIPMKVIGVPI
jgi:hypothetical protein